MNWGKILIGGLVAGIAKNIFDFLTHGLALAGTYASMPEVYTQEQANPLYFVLIAVCQAIAAAIVFSRTRQLWNSGAVGGAHYGFLIGLIAMFREFYDPLVIDGFPYYLAWCHGSIALFGFTIAGAVLGLIIKRTEAS